MCRVDSKFAIARLCHWPLSEVHVVDPRHAGAPFGRMIAGIQIDPMEVIEASLQDLKTQEYDWGSIAASL